jgi:hypothetical protein
MEIICSTKEFDIYMDKKKHSLFKITNKNNSNDFLVLVFRIG